MSAMPQTEAPVSSPGSQHKLAELMLLYVKPTKLSTNLFPTNMYGATFSFHVPNILRLTSNPEMQWIYT